MPKDFTLPSGKVAVIKTDLTGRDKRKLKVPFYGGIKVEPGEDGKVQVTQDKIGADAFDKAEDALIEISVVSLDGSSDDILNRVLDLPSDDYDALLGELNGAKKKDTTSQAT